MLLSWQVFDCRCVVLQEELTVSGTRLVLFRETTQQLIQMAEQAVTPVLEVGRCESTCHLCLCCVLMMLLRRS